MNIHTLPYHIIRCLDPSAIIEEQYCSHKTFKNPKTSLSLKIIERLITWKNLIQEAI